MDKQEIIAFFDDRASSWDAEMIRDDGIISQIFDNAGIREGDTVLDVACGTGVLLGDYAARGVKHVTAIDISPEMAKICAAKYPAAEVICGDVEETDFGRTFDRIMIYNAFPHFPDPERVIARLSGLLNPGGTLTVAHGMSREKIDCHHQGTACHVSRGLMSENELSAIFSRNLEVICVISNEKMYQVTGKKA